MKSYKYKAVFLFILFLNSNPTLSADESSKRFKKYPFNHQIIEELSSSPHDYKYQVSAQKFAMKNEITFALEHFDTAFPFNENRAEIHQQSIQDFEAELSNIKVAPAIPVLLKASEEHKIFILNEAHHHPLHREFARSLLQGLYDRGYRLFGIETLENKTQIVDELNKNKYPQVNDGYYLGNPSFGNLVRDALQIGFKVFAYEIIRSDDDKSNLSMQEKIELRETAQAKNIAKILKANPNDKAFIFCGFGHSKKGEKEFFGKAMAQRLSELTKLNPFTVNQTHYIEHHESRRDHPAIKHFSLNESLVVLNQDESPRILKEEQAWDDIAVIHPRTTLVNGRPDWLFRYNKQLDFKLDKNLDIEYPIQVLVYNQGENPLTAVPIDLVELEAPIDSVSLAVHPKRQHKIYLRSISGEVIELR